MMKKRWRILIAGCLACAALCGCAKENSGGTPVTMYEVAHSIFYAPQYAAIELGYFKEEGIDLTLVNGAGADKVMTAMLAGDADIGFMGSEASIYTYAQGAEDYAVNFAQLTQRAGNFLVARQPDLDFSWQKLRGSRVLGGRAGGMPQMVFEYILKKNGMDPKTDLTIDQSIQFGLTAAAFTSDQSDYTVEFEPFATGLELEGNGYVVASLGTRLRICTLYCVLRETELSGHASGSHSEIYKCAPKGHGLCEFPYGRGNRKDHPAAICGNSAGKYYKDCETVSGTGYLERESCV